MRANYALMMEQLNKRLREVQYETYAAAAWRAYRAAALLDEVFTILDADPTPASESLPLSASHPMFHV